jgi:hypothetical protein
MRSRESPSAGSRESLPLVSLFEEQGLSTRRAGNLAVGTSEVVGVEAWRPRGARLDKSDTAHVDREQGIPRT